MPSRFIIVPPFEQALHTDANDETDIDRKKMRLAGSLVPADGTLAAIPRTSAHPVAAREGSLHPFLFVKKGPQCPHMARKRRSPT
jgi:hypothetical protein